MSAPKRVSPEQVRALSAAQPPASAWRANALTGALHLLAATLVPAVSIQLAWHAVGPRPLAAALGLAALVACAYCAAAVLGARLASYPPHSPRASVALAVSLCWLPLGLAVRGLAVHPLWAFLGVSWLAAFAAQLAVIRATPKRRLRYGLVPGGIAEALHALRVEGIVPLALGEAPDVDVVLVDRALRLDPQWKSLVDSCRAAGVPVEDAASVHEKLVGRVEPRTLAVLEEPDFGYAPVKKAADLALITAALPLWGPLAALTALAVRLDSPGPIFFWQQRVGTDGRAFRMLKFRSMRTDSEVQGPKFASQKDDRVTRVGRVIRKLRLDELPQFWNVLRGEMSLIGPRPEQATFVRRFEKDLRGYRHRHAVKPGITGWAQVSSGYAADEDETRLKLQYDLYYIKNCSPGLDLLIAVRTIATMLTGFGAR